MDRWGCLKLTKVDELRSYFCEDVFQTWGLFNVTGGLETEQMLSHFLSWY